MDRFKQIGKSLRKDRAQTELNTRRIQANYPLVERKLDNLAGDDSYRLEFPVSGHDHTVSLNLRLRPDNCCDCEPGAQTVKRDAIGYMSTNFPDPNWYTTNFGSVPTGEMQQAIYIPILVQTGTTFNFGYRAGIWAPLYQEYPYFGGYEIVPEGGIMVPVDGMYAVMFRQEIGIYTDRDSYLVTAILQNGESISQKTYSVAKGNLGLGNLHGKVYYQYAFCVPLHAGDVVGAGLKSNAISWSIRGERGTANSTRIVLLGLGFGVLIGKVFDQVTGLPISGATVSYTIGFGGSTTTNENGMYEFTELTPGPYSVTVTKSGYISMTRDIQVLFDDIVNLDFNLEPV
jgi:hypothetical protein